MTTNLNLHDIQGNVLKTYARKQFKYARYVFFGVKNAAQGRQFVVNLIPLITTAAAWKRPGDDGEELPKPPATTNIAFTYHGLKRLSLPEESLHGFPEEFSMGMRERRDILGDTGSSAPEKWDPVWNKETERVDIWLSINGQNEKAIEERYAQIQNILAASNGRVIQLTGHRGDNGADDLLYQDAAALIDSEGNSTRKEHFGYTDGISNPFF